MHDIEIEIIHCLKGSAVDAPIHSQLGIEAFSKEWGILYP